MNCEQIKRMIPDYLQDNLDQILRLKVEEHIKICGDCKKEFEAVEKIWHKIVLVPEEKPSEHLRSRFEEMLVVYKAGFNQSTSTDRLSGILGGWLERLWPKTPAYQFGFAMVFMIFGLFMGRWFFSLDHSNGEIAQIREELRDMSQLVTLSLLKQQSPSERLKGVSYTYQIRQPDEDVLTALVQTLNSDPNVNVRSEAAHALSYYLQDPFVKRELLQSLSKQTSPLVQIEIIDCLVRSRDKQSVEAFQNLLKKNELHDLVKQRAQWGIQQLG